MFNEGGSILDMNISNQLKQQDYSRFIVFIFVLFKNHVNIYIYREREIVVSL